MKPEQTGHEPCGCSSDQLREKLPSTGEIQSVADAMAAAGRQQPAADLLGAVPL